MTHNSVKLEIMSPSNNNDISEVDVASPSHNGLETKYIGSPNNER